MKGVERQCAGSGRKKPTLRRARGPDTIFAQGDTAPDVLASVLAREPDLTALPSSLNPRLVELIRRCLEKQPKRRWQAIGDVRAELEAIAASPRTVPVPAQVAVPAKPLWKRSIPIVVSAMVASALTGLAAVWSLRPSLPPTITRFRFTLQESEAFTNPGRQVVAISPDGTQVV